MGCSWHREDIVPRLAVVSKMPESVLNVWIHPEAAENGKAGRMSRWNIRIQLTNLNHLR